MSARAPFFYGWWILAGSVVAMALISGLSFWSFTLYIEPLEDEFGWSRAEVSLGFSVGLMVSALVAPFVGRWIDANGPRSAIVVGTVLTALSYVLLSTTQELWQWYLYSTIAAVFRQMMFFIPFQALISRWFDRRRGMALGILGTGFSLGGFAVIPALNVVIEEVGWDGSFIFSGAVLAAVLVPMALLLLRNSPSDVGTVADGVPRPGEVRRPPTPIGGLTLGEALRTPFFWVLAAAMTLFFFGVFSWLVHQVPFYESVGVSRGTAAALVSVAAGFGILSRIAFGSLADRIPRIEAAAMGLLVAFMAGLSVLMIDSSGVGIAIFLAFWIVGSGGGPLLEPLLLPRSFGMANFGAILGTFAVVETVGLVVSPTLAGAIYDATGSYDLVLVMMFCAFAASFALFWLTLRMPLPYAVRGHSGPVETQLPADAAS